MKKITFQRFASNLSIENFLYFKNYQFNKFIIK